MTVISVDKNPDTLSMTITARFAAPVDRVWQIWDDPRQLERWWGPPTYPATVTDHDLRQGGRVAYSMTGPQGDTHHGWWEISAVQPPRSLEFADGFADAEGHPNPDMPVVSVRVALHAESDTATRMEVRTVFPSAEAMEQLLTMGMDEGMSLAMGQIDDVLSVSTR